ncbi:hypothetical protein KFL_002850180 [Klebsormidium nitens]|uniref:Uncharacterized protein n=1 Tax=Klebsormidium nitens TaxID=105231 RepID=A0A1Y1I5Y7_KLENI|nr:hypothetical protein KFL_002850180 [Klebsormidium nitens]|eukprot:GAQ86374.1 hypothetical protein KFL_002850180 [Klebsormidium nitens]
MHKTRPWGQGHLDAKPGGARRLILDHTPSSPAGADGMASRVPQSKGAPPIPTHPPTYGRAAAEKRETDVERDGRVSRPGLQVAIAPARATTTSPPASTENPTTVRHAPGTASPSSSTPHPVPPPAQPSTMSPPRFGYQGAHVTTKDLLSPTRQSLAAGLGTGASSSSPAAEPKSDHKGTVPVGQQRQLIGSPPQRQRGLLSPQREAKSHQLAAAHANLQGAVAARISHGQQSKGQPLHAPHAVGHATHSPLSPTKKAPSDDQARPAHTRPPTSPPGIKSPPTSPPSKPWKQAAASTPNSGSLPGSSRGGQRTGALGGRADKTPAVGRGSTPATKEEPPHHGQLSANSCPRPQQLPQFAAEDAPRKQWGEASEKGDGGAAAPVMIKLTAADGEAVAPVNESEGRTGPSSASANGAKDETAGAQAVEVAEPAIDEVATWQAAAAPPLAATGAQLAADVERLQAAVSQAEERNRALEAQLAEAHCQLALLRIYSLTNAVAGGQASEEIRAAAIQDQLCPVSKPAQVPPIQDPRLNELETRVHDLNALLQERAAELLASQLREQRAHGQVAEQQLALANEE